ncbi:transporter substrate-binding domain-containing protein [Actinomadura sp. 1N219]|uniref:transporter substrate-binding domain-containing protein n=1 Tax=Actinomadura sp. 1N219 TaxID=3375152 RepID=UPI0037A06D36
MHLPSAAPSRGRATTRPGTARQRITAALAVGVLALTAACSSGQDDPSGSAPGAGGEVNLAEQKQLKPAFTKDEKLHGMLPDKVKQAGVVNVALSTGNPPITMPGRTQDTVSGLVPDLQTAVSQLLGVKFEGVIYPTTAAQLLAISSGRAQMAWSTNADTRERQQKYDFVDYMKINYVLAVAPRNPKKINETKDVCGKVYGSVKGSIDISDAVAAMCKKNGLDAPKISYLEDVPSMLLALKSGRIDTYLTTDTYIVYERSQGNEIESVPPPMGADTMFGITISKQDKELSAAVLAALKKLHDEGWYKQAFDHWGVTKMMVQPGLNIGDQTALFG